MKQMVERMWRDRLNICRALLACVLAYFATRAIFTYTGVSPEKSVLSMVFFAAGVYLLMQAFRVQAHRVHIAAALLSMLFAGAMVLGQALKTEGVLTNLYHTRHELLETAKLWGGFCAIFYAPLVLAFSVLLREGVGESKLDPPTKKQQRWRFWLLWALMLACWAPFFIGAFPGALSDDPISQMSQIYGKNHLINHHPVIHTGMLAACLRLGEAIHSRAAGLALYSAVQSAIMAAIFVYAVQFLMRMRVSRIYASLVFALFALSPVHGMYSIATWKDTLHGGFTLLMVVLLLQQAHDPKAFFASKAKMAGFVAVGFLFSTFRNNGLYAFLLFLPMLLLYYRRYWKRMLAMICAVVLMLGVYRGPVFRALDVLEGSQAEMLTTPMQQIARTVVSHGGELSEQEKAILSEVWSVEEIPQRYLSFIADPIKLAFNMQRYNQDPGRYASLWWQLFRQYPGTYLVAFLAGTYGYWYPEAKYWVLVFTALENPFGFEPLASPQQIDRIYKYINRDSVPGLGTSLLYSIAVMIWVLLFAAALCALKRKWRLMPPFVLLFLLYLTVLLSPVFAEYRYTYGFQCAAPILLGAMFVARRFGIPEEV